jgi:coenzyme F420 biosynthesis associated uncharacterized protein
MAGLIEPRIAKAVARRVAGDSLPPPPLVDRLTRDLDQAVRRSEELVAHASGIPPPPPVLWGVIDRSSWAEANIAGMTQMLSPLADKMAKRMAALSPGVRLAQKALVSVEVGALLGYISRRVLGQYDVLVPEADDALERPRRTLRSRRSFDASPGPSLYFVGSNIIETEGKYEFVPADFALWVALHEVTHRFQFSGVPWLKAHFFRLVESYLESVDLDTGTLASRLATAGRRLLSKTTPPEERNPAYLFATEQQRRLLDDIQALMAVVEGHGNYVMDSVGARVVPSFNRMRRVFDQRRRQSTALQRAINHALGIEMKLRQYELGQRFCESVVARGGTQALAHLWADPANFPTLVELREPQLWLRRVA